MKRLLVCLTALSALVPGIALADDRRLDRNYEVIVPGEVLGLLAILVAAFLLFRALRTARDLAHTAPRMRGLTLALLSGVLLYLAFPPFNFGWLGWVALVPMILAQLLTGDRRRETDDGSEHSAISHRPSVNNYQESKIPRPPSSILRRLSARFEIENVYQALMLFVAYSLVFMHVFPAELPTGYPIPVWPFIVLAVALVSVLFAYTGWPSGSFSSHRRTNFRWFIIVPALGWMGLEELRVIVQAGQEWARIPATQYLNSPLIQLAAFGGQWLVGALVVAANYAIALLLFRIRQHGYRNAVSVVRNAYQPLVTLALVLVAHFAGYSMLKQPTQSVRVATIQRGMDLGDSPHYMTFWNVADWKGMDDAVLADFEPMIRSAASQGAKVIALPEAVLWEDPAQTPALQHRLIQLAKDTGAYITFTFYLWHDPDSRNEVYTATPTGQWLGPYAKNHPIAYIGEYSVTAGQFPVYDTTFGNFANFVCYDNTYTDVASHMASLGASMLTSSNHDWPEGAWGFYTQSVFRAVENHIAIVRSDWRVSSAIIDPYGRIVTTTKIDERQQAVLVADVPIIQGARTFYTQTGDWLAYIGMAVLVVMLFVNVRLPWQPRAVVRPV